MLCPWSTEARRPAPTCRDKAFRSVRADAGLGADVVPHVLRHTAITWTAQQGILKHEICGMDPLIKSQSLSL
jgi:integrase